MSKKIAVQTVHGLNINGYFVMTSVVLVEMSSILKLMQMLKQNFKGGFMLIKQERSLSCISKNI